MKNWDADGCEKGKHDNSQIKINNNFDTKIKHYWKSDDSKILFMKNMNGVWTDAHRMGSIFKFVEEKFDEIIPYNEKERIYFKLNSTCIKTGKELDQIKNEYALGKWIY